MCSSGVAAAKVSHLRQEHVHAEPMTAPLQWQTDRDQHKLTCNPALQEYQFRGIEKSEWNNLFSFIQAKRLRIENVDEAKEGPAGPNRTKAFLEELRDDDEIGPGGPLNRQQRMH